MRIEGPTVSKIVSVLSFILNLCFRFLRKKKLYALVWIPLETQTNFNKTKILSKYFAYSARVVVDGPRFNLSLES